MTHSLQSITKNALKTYVSTPFHTPNVGGGWILRENRSPLLGSIGTFHTLKYDKYDRVGLWHSGAMKWTQFSQISQGRAYDKYEKYDRVGVLRNLTNLTG